MSAVKCRCGSELHRVDGWVTEPEGMRGNYFCPECMVMWEMHKMGLSKIGILKDPYSVDLVSSIQNQLQHMIGNLDKLKKSPNNS